MSAETDAPAAAAAMPCDTATTATANTAATVADGNTNSNDDHNTAAGSSGAVSAATTTTTTTAASAAQQKKSAANSYYYWHGHEKERAKVGDVAPMPTPVLVKKHDDDDAAVAAATRALAEVPVTRYSWADSDTHVTVYIDTLADDRQPRETLDEASVSVSFTKHSCDVAFVTRTAASSSSSQRRRRLVLPLAQKIDARASSYKLRMPAARLVLRLTKASPGTWFDLVRDTHTTRVDTPSASSTDSESDNDDLAEGGDGDKDATSATAATITVSADADKATDEAA